MKQFLEDLMRQESWWYMAVGIYVILLIVEGLYHQWFTFGAMIMSLAAGIVLKRLE